MHRRLGPFASGLVVAAVLAASCSDTREAKFDGRTDRTAIERAAGMWRAEGAIPWRLTICDAPERSFCEANACGKPCHEIRVDGPAETLGYEQVDTGCDCYGCECFAVRAGFPVLGLLRVEGAGGAAEIEGRGELASRIGDAPNEVELVLRAGDATYRGSFEDDVVVLELERRPDAASPDAGAAAVALPLAARLRRDLDRAAACPHR
jgi:hypothetical protein